MSHTLVQDMTYISVTDFEENCFLILEKIVFWFWRKSFSDLRKSFSDFGENRFLILKKIVFWFFHDFITQFIQLYCIQKKIVCKSRLNRVILTRFLTRFIPQFFLVWAGIGWPLTKYMLSHCLRMRQREECVITVLLHGHCNLDYQL